MKKIFVIIVIFISFLSGQNFDVASVGMAGNYTALGRGVSAMAWNPANLCSVRGNSFELNLFSVNLAAFNNTFSINDYNRYLTAEGNNGRWTDNDKQGLLNLIPDDGIQSFLNTSTNILGFAFNNFAFTIQSVTQGQVSLSENKEPFNMVLDGVEITNDYSFKNSGVVEGEMFGAIKMSAGYAYPIALRNLIPGISKISVGLGINYFAGLAIARTVHSDVIANRYENETEDEMLYYKMNLETNYAYVDGNFPAGNGFSLDFGATTKYRSAWTFSWAFSNLFGSIRWNQNTEKYVLLETDSVLIDNLLEGKDSETSVSVDSTYNRSNFSTRLPVKMRMGAAYQLLDELVLTMDWHQGFDHHFGNTTTPKVGVGAEYFAMDWLPLRMGMSVGGNRGFLFGLGFGLHISAFQFDYSYAMNNGMWPTYSEGLFTAIGMKLRF
jgi:hypothetical protein